MLSRRGFLNATLGTGLGLSIPAARPVAAQPASRRRMIVDGQVHLWKAETPDWRWVPGAVPQLPEPFTIEKLVPLMDEAGVDRVVIVPPGWPGDRNDYALEAVHRYPNRFAIMGRIPLRDPSSAALLPKWKEQRGMLGVRLTFLGPQGALMSDGTADWFWPAAEKAGLPVMILAPGKGQDLARIAERHPGLTLIIDHMNLSLSVESVRAGQFADAIDPVAALAKFPNVSVKLSSAPTYSREPYPYRDINPFIKRLYDAFGPQRCYWGTDMTNSFAKATYRQRITHFTEELPFLSEADKDLIMGRAIATRLGWS